MVAMEGASIAAPLAMPPTFTVALPAPCPNAAGRSSSTSVCLRTVSVVSIASAAALPPATSALSDAASFGMPASTGAIGIGIPIRPVWHTSTSVGAHPSDSAVSVHMRSASDRPTTPVAALALPELSTTAAARRSPRCVRDTWTGAAATRLPVNTPAAVTGARSAVAIIDRSGAPAGVMPRARPPASNPTTAVTVTA